MTSKTKALKKGNYTPGKANPAPAKKAENKVTNNHIARNVRKEAEARSRARRMRSMLKLGMSKEQIEEIFAQENNRMVLVLLNGNYTVQDGEREKKIRHRDKKTKTTSIEVVKVPNILCGFAAAKKYADDNKLEFMSGSRNAIWIHTDKDHVDEVVEKLKVLGRTSVTKPELRNKETEKTRIEEEKKTPKKPTNNTVEVRKAAKAARKQANIEKANMRPYYAALRKGGVNARIKKHNPTLAEKIEKWLKDVKKAEAEKADRIDKHKRDHRQMSSIEMKANKHARKAAKSLAAKERRMAAEKKRAESNAIERAKHVQKAQKPVQTELKMAA